MQSEYKERVELANIANPLLPGHAYKNEQMEKIPKFT